VKPKWYLEFPAVLTMIILGIVFAWNLSLPSCHKTEVTVNNNDTATRRPALDANWEEGRELFKANCAACHNPKADGTGPALIGVTARWKAAGDYKGISSDKWLKMWIRNYNDVVGAGYKYGIDLHNSRSTQMNVFGPFMTDDKIDKILLYVENPDKYSSARRF
jgi:mono/diheme cytochrome c family protein